MTCECFSLFVLLHFDFIMIACIFVDLLFFFLVNWFLVIMVNEEDSGGLVGRTSLN